MPRGSAPGERRGGRRKGTPNRRTVLFEEAIKHAVVSGDGDAVDFLTRIYRNPDIPLSVRIDCAKVVAPFERPRLTAMTNRDGKDLAQTFLPPDRYRAWARQQIREAFGLPRGDEGEP
jgi:hypothetical protein